MSRALINGDFLCKPLTGVERYGYETTARLDRISGKGEAAIIIPRNVPKIPDYKNLEVIRFGRYKSHILWQMLSLQFYLVFHRDFILLEYGNSCLPVAPGITVLHDIYCELFPEDFTSFWDKVIRVYNRWQYRLIVKKAKQVVTVSCFSKNQIVETLHANPERIRVIQSSYFDFKHLNADYSIFDDFPVLKNPYYFILGSLSKRKNIRWVLEYARKNPQTRFAISGTRLPTAEFSDLDDIKRLPNISLLGYVSDRRMKALMEKCTAYILPSYYEGFGITGLEALSAGARVIAANAASLPEIYGGAVNYIDPYNTDIVLEDLLKEPVSPPGEILGRYSHDKTAGEFLQLIRSICSP
jgi:glycosyltransferase involved in cell wall biosynthesis